VGLAAGADDALAGLEIAEDAVAAGDDAAGRVVGAADDVAEVVDGDAGVVVMPTAIPVEPFIRRFGRAEGRTVGSVVDSL
jgi:hypothetical protein